MHLVAANGQKEADDVRGQGAAVCQMGPFRRPTTIPFDIQLEPPANTARRRGRIPLDLV